VSELEIAAAVLMLASVALTVVEDVWCWPVGAVAVVLYAIVFREQRVYANMGLQGVYFILQLYGWHEWLRGGDRGGELGVSRAPLRLMLVLGLLGVAGTVGLGAALHLLTDGVLPYWDAAVTAFSLVAQWMLARKLLESWLVWIGVDVLAIALFAVQGLYPTAGVFGTLLVMSVAGYWGWTTSLRDPKSA
jgi:nicotinamide mononucleotide transporter